LLTHQGPQLSETSFDRSQYPTRSVAAGSTHLNKLYERKDIVGWFHGHTHQGSNYSKYKLHNLGYRAYK
jgi:Icc-related predicted phosphoesterase